MTVGKPASQGQPGTTLHANCPTGMQGKLAIYNELTVFFDHELRRLGNETFPPFANNDGSRSTDAAVYLSMPFSPQFDTLGQPDT